MRPCTRGTRSLVGSKADAGFAPFFCLQAAKRLKSLNARKNLRFAMPNQPNTREPNAAASQDTRSKLQKDASPADALAADKARSEAVDLRIAGKSFRAIADAMGISLETAHRYVQDGWERLNERTDDARERLRDMQEARLDAALRVIMPLLTTEDLMVETVDKKGNVVQLDAAELKLKAVDRLVKVIHSQNLLRGLNAPIKVETAPQKPLEPIENLVARMKELSPEVLLRPWERRPGPLPASGLPG